MWTRGKFLGSGAFGSVFLATSTPGGCFDQQPIMAVKSSILSNADSLSSERVVLKDLQGCSNIIACYAADLTSENDQDYYNLLLEYADGGTLADRIRSCRQKKLTEAETKRYTHSMLTGLSYMHNQGYVHCDIKPENILLVGKTAKIADLGLAKKVGETLNKNKANKLRGTLMYIAPESVKLDEYEPKIDVWALGCTVLESITGKKPWNYEDFAVYYKLGYTDELPEIPSWVSNEARDFLKKCLVRDPNLRWSAEMLLSHPYVSSAVDNNLELNRIKREGGDGERRSRRLRKGAKESKPMICNIEPIVNNKVLA